MFRKQLFAKKSLEVVLQEMAGEHRLRRVLGPVTLSSLGIGAIIGTGIFVLTGVAARQHAGPGLVLSFVIAGLACAFAALCYAEFASMAPIAGSAYTYAYVSLGEVIAWIIGWDLILEYAMASATVANGWSHYFLKFIGLFKTKAGQAVMTVPAWLAMDPFSVATQHTDYQTSQTLVVASATALPMGAAEDPVDTESPDRFAIPVRMDSGTERVSHVRVSFTAASLEAVWQLHGEEAAKASIARVEKSLRQNLEYDPAVKPAKSATGAKPQAPPPAAAEQLAAKLQEVAQEYRKGYDAYEETPLVLGSLHLTCNVVAIAISIIITTILVIGIRESAGFNALMVLVKIAAVLFVIFVGMWKIDVSNWTPFMPYGWSGIFAGAAVIFFAYIGFDSVSTHAEEAKNPKVDVPIGIISSLAVCTVLYIAVAAVITGMIPYPQIPFDAPIAFTFESKGMEFAVVIITVGALTGITSVLLVMLLSQPRVFLAMARDGLLPEKFFGAVHPRFRTPHKATILTGTFCAVAASLFPLEGLSHMVNIGTLFAFVVVCASVWLMRRLNPDAERPFRTPAVWLVAPAGIAMCLILMGSLPTETWYRLVVWLAAGLLIYLFYGRHHSHLGKALRGEISRHGVSPAGMPLDGGEVAGE